MRIGTLHEGQALVVHHVFRPDNSRQALEVGALLPGHATALGKVLLAHNPYATEELIDAGLDAFTPRDGRPTRTRSRQELHEVRGRGWASDVEELVEGEVSLAAPIQDRRGVTVGAIGISGPDRAAVPTAEGPRSDLISYVREAARAVSRDLGRDPVVRSL